MSLLFRVDAADPASYSGSGTTWFDTSGNGRDVTLINGPTFTSGGPKYFSFVPNQYGDFSPTGLVYGSAPRSVGIWVRYQSFYNPFGAFAYGIYDNSKSFGAFADGSKFYALSHADDFGVTGTPQLGRFYFLVATYDGTTAKIFVNGILAGSGPKTWNTVSGYARMGQYLNSGYYANCSIGKASIWNTALTDGEVAGEYAADATRFASIDSPVALVLGAGISVPQADPGIPDHGAPPSVL